jgi:hypothetical protein
MAGCLFRPSVTRTRTAEWRLEGIARPYEVAQLPMVDEAPWLWLPSGGSVGAVSGSPVAAAYLGTGAGPIPDVDVRQAPVAADCCGSTLVLVARTARGGVQSYLHLEAPMDELRLWAASDARIVTTAAETPARGGRFTFTDLEAAGVVMHRGSAFVRWQTATGRLVGWESVSHLPPPRGRQVAERLATVDGELVRQAFLIVEGARPVAFAEAPRVDFATSVAGVVATP